MSPPIAVESDSASVGSSSVYDDSHHQSGTYQHSAHASSNNTHEELSRSTTATPIAVCGMAVRLPGSINTPQQLWEFLVSKGDARGRVPASRYNIDAFHSPDGKPGTVKTEYGYFLDESIDLGALDTSFFSLRKGEVDRTDPHQRQMLEVARECMEDAGEVNWRGRNIGCYMGTFGEDWIEVYAKETQQYGTYRATGHGDFMMPNRISFEMDLRGPSMIVRTACSSALVALHEACQAIGRGDCEAALVGGANLILAPYMTTTMTEQGVLSPDGSCKTFSADANGYARGEAVNAVYLKPLADALRDGNPIRAVIRGTASNCDGKSPGGLSCPSVDAQVALMRRAYGIAGIDDFSQTAFVECHGTGTSVGDPIETDAVAAIFGPTGGVHIGSVKPNLGHSEGASGLTSLIKSILALENKTLPPNIKFSSPHPNIKFDVGLKVPVEPTSWPESRHERISVNSFGIGGSNAHVIVDSAASFGISKKSHKRDTPQLLLFSGNTADSIKQMTANYGEFLDRNPESIADLSYTLANRREHLFQRSFAVAKKHATLTTSAITKTGSQAPKVAMVFTGQGAQWPLMGRELLEDPDYPVFKKTIKLLDKYLQTASFRPDWTIEEELLHPPRTSRLNTAELSQPLCTAVQLALVDTLASIGITPTAVVGHSSGELAAAYAAGALTAREAIVAAFHRGVVSKLQNKPGAMAAIGWGAEEVKKYLIPGVVIACENSPKSVTLSGDAAQVRKVVSAIKDADDDVLARLLKVDKAYHSHHMVEIGKDYHALIEKEVASRHPTKLFFSSVTGSLLGSETSLDATYWQKNLESPVLFRSAVTSLLQHESVGKDVLLLEIGPHSALAGPLRQIQAQISKNVPYVSVLARDEDCVETFLNAVGKLHCANVAVDFKHLIPHGRTLPDLPRYPWSHTESYWYESRLSKEWRNRLFPYHDLLGVRLPESTEFEPTWRNLFHLDNAKWIRDHKIKDDVVFPFAGYASMVGEAIRQLQGGIQESYTLSHVVVSTALVLAEGKPTEIMTSFRRVRLTDALDSDRWEFSITSHNGNVWLKHCTGEVKAGPASPWSGSPRSLPPRKVTAQRCYDTMQRAGLKFGPTFRTLQDIRSETTSELATASAHLHCVDKDFYQLHPTLIDAGLQILIVAATRGFSAEKDAQMLVPTNIDELTVFSSTASDIDITASAAFTNTGGILGQSTSTAEGKTVMAIRGLRLTCIDDGDGQQGGNPTARAEWGPHIDFTDVPSLIKNTSDRKSVVPDLDDLIRLCMTLSKRKIAGLKTEIPHLQRYADWVDRQLQVHDDVSSSVWHKDEPGYKAEAGLSKLSNEELTSRMDALGAKLAKTPAVDAAAAIRVVCDNFDKIFTGETEALELLYTDDLLTRTYRFVDESDRSALFERLAFSKPNLRVLEIGAGTGATTAAILASIAPGAASGKSTMFSEYVYTDISAGMFAGPKERFKHIANIEYAVLDIVKDLADQGFADRKFDLIVASNVIHATNSLHNSCVNVCKLLAPEGRFFLTEINSVSKWLNYIWGTLSGWWEGAENDHRPDEPYISPERWESVLKEAGFEGIEAVVLDSEAPYHVNNMILAKPAHHKFPVKKVTALCHDVNEPSPVLAELEKRGYSIERKTLDDLPFAPEQDVISTLDLSLPFFSKLTADRLEHFQKFIKSIQSGSGIFWVTKSCQMDCRDPRYAQSIGLARTMRSELQVDLATCEVDDVEGSVDLIADVFAKFQIREEDDTFRPEMEYVINKRAVNVARLFPCKLQDEAAEEEEQAERAVFRTSKPGRLSDLHWAKAEQVPLVNDDIEVLPYASGLNFKDILVAMGIVGASKEGFGLESAGVISRIGPDVKDLKVGDRVILMGYSAFATHTVISENLCAKMPDNLSFDDGATMPCVYATSVYSLFHVGNLKKGQSVLIHSACGGIGISSIQLAKMVGAEIFATVGNQEKVDYLMKTFGIPRNRIFNSRDTSFVEDILRETNGEGVDLAFNSLSGELLHATWKCIAKFGKLVEIGKRDLLGAAKLDMTPFLDNRSYCCVDLDQLCFLRPAMLKKLLVEVMDLFSAGHISPIRPIKVVPAADILEAFRFMQQGQHMGKIVISIREETGKVNVPTEVQSQEKAITFDSSAYYLLVGGLGGLGRSISTWMIEHGARHLIYLSRSAADAEQHHDFVQEVESMGAEAKMIPGSVSNAEDVQRAVDAAKGNLKGVLQMSMVLSDQAFEKMTIDEWNTASKPKVEGTWNLHEATKSETLDFFVLFSSLSGVMGQPGQANYASANTFLDAFAQFRQSLGLAASVIDIGAVQEIGYVAQNEKLLQRLDAFNALGNVSRNGLLKCVGAAMTSVSHASTAPHNAGATYSSRRGFTLGLESSVPINDPENPSLWKKDIRMAVYHNASGDGSGSSGSSNDALKGFLAKAKHEVDILRLPETTEFLATEICRKLFSLLLKPEEDIDISSSLANLGMDSLVAIEMRTWWKAIFGFDISVLEMLNMGTLDALGKHAAEGLLKLYSNDGEGEEAKAEA